MNKKAGFPAGGIFGAMLFWSLLLILILFFSSCTKVMEAKEIVQIAYSKEEFFLSEDLNSFLQIQYGENRRVSDIITAYLSEFYIGESTGGLDASIDAAEQEKFKKQMDELASGRIPLGIRFIIVQPGGGIIYDNFNKPQFRQISYEDTSEASATLPIPVGLNDFIFVQAIFQR
ncbi:hypothetical protein J4410_07830 [Candidatus Woesearchaeota archaeon]|nr:hypothetical protein [Candidatus Woesearchaeota archaeon]